MSNALAIASVSAVLKDLLNNGIIDNDVSGAVGGNVTVSVLPPDRIMTEENGEPTQLNLYLYKVAPNNSWRSAGLPTRDGNGERMANPPLALDLFYLLTSFGSEEYHAEILLGYAMQIMHEHPVLTRNAIRRALQTSPLDNTILPPAFQSLTASDLADQVSLIKITPAQKGDEAMSNLWSAFQTQFRLSTVYQASVVLIQSHKPKRSALPVLMRGPDDSGVHVQPSMLPPLPTLTHIQIPGNRPSAAPGDTIEIHGLNLGGSDHTIRFKHPLHTDEIVIPVTDPAHISHTMVTVTLPASLSDPAPPWLPGIYTVRVSVRRENESFGSLTNAIPMAMAPGINTISGQRDDDTVTFTIECNPPVHPAQTISLIVGQRETFSDPITETATNLVFSMTDLTAGEEHYIRLRVDGIDSHLIDYEATPPEFRDSEKVTIP